MAPTRDYVPNSKISGESITIDISETLTNATINIMGATANTILIVNGSISNSTISIDTHLPAQTPADALASEELSAVEMGVIIGFSIMAALIAISVVVCFWRKKARSRGRARGVWYGR